MSFFNDFLDYFDVSDMSNQISIFSIIGIGLIVEGNVSVLNLSSELIELKTPKGKISIFGENLLIKSISKGEVVIEGKVLKTEIGEMKWIMLK